MILGCSGAGLWHQDRINDVNHTIRLDHVVGGDVGYIALRVLEHYVMLAIHHHREFFSRDGGEHRFSLAVPLLPSIVALRPGSADAEIIVVTNWIAELKEKLGKK